MNEGLFFGILIGIFIGITIMAVSTHYVIIEPQAEQIAELGQSICEEEYGLDFESYVDKTLKCKPAANYDGITVKVTDEKRFYEAINKTLNEMGAEVK